MRTISSGLEAAQKSLSGTPFVELVFYNPDGGSVDYTSRKKLIEHHEEPYNDYAIILLGNEDKTVIDLTGYYVDIVYGNDGEGVATPRLWVKSQSNISMQGKLVSALTLEGGWTVAGEQVLRVGSPPLYNDQFPYTTQTVYDLLGTIISELAIATGFCFTLLALGDQDDGIIDTFTPEFSPNQTKFDDCNTLLQVLVEMTKCYLRIKAELAFEVLYPQEDDDVDETYYSDRAFYFTEYDEVMNVIVPNHVIVFCNQGEQGWVGADIITGEASDSGQIAKYTEVIGVFTAPTVRNQTDATNRANAILTKLQAEILSGRLIIPHDCRVELYDRVKVYDNRGE
ncbi:hypothetical protein LCGC14_0527180 [marine sediment metagenome]|uniref:Uncharacterized protein n=1 Tax=marine sediment metagenome TaxID=412755 RepID=A0A0F9S1F9_9ZZZZ